ncbi:MAG TPA: helix-turn-helix transcriptional regulator, partial [Myxococcota bacterium]|nr:helix-turn-helix transcriptional regulator [Myxococcota bacterium]
MTHATRAGAIRRADDLRANLGLPIYLVDIYDRYIMIELGLLGLLAEQNLHGYELKKQLGELLGSWSLSFGSLYPALNRLERAELVKAVEANLPVEPSIPMTG